MFSKLPLPMKFVMLPHHWCLLFLRGMREEHQEFMPKACTSSRIIQGIKVFLVVLLKQADNDIGQQRYKKLLKEEEDHFSDNSRRIISYCNAMVNYSCVLPIKLHGQWAFNMLQSKSKASFEFLMMFMIWLNLTILVSDVALQEKEV